MLAAFENEHIQLDIRLVQPAVVSGSVRLLALFCKEGSVNAAASPGKVQQLAVQGNENSVQEPEATELSNNLEPADCRVPLISFLK
jgi:hypothetical protein